MYNSEDQANNSNEILNDLSPEEQAMMDKAEEYKAREDRQPTLTWSPESQQRLLGCIVAEPALAEAAEQMEFRSEYFADEAHAALGKIVIDFRTAYGRHPDSVEVRHEISKLPDAKRMRSEVEYELCRQYNVDALCESSSIAYWTDQLREFCEFHALLHVALDAARHKKVDLEKAIDRLNKVRSAGNNKSKTRIPYTVSGLKALPVPEWHVENIFPHKGFVVVWGPSGAGKSFVAIDWALCSATGKPWLGHAVKQGAALYIAAEGSSGVRKRCQRWLDYHRLPEPDNFWVVPEAYDLLQHGEVTELLRLIDGLPYKPEMVVIDPLFRNMTGSDSDPKDMTAFIWAETRIQQATQATLVTLHHTGWNSERERGFSGLRQAADTMISVEKPGGIDAPLTDGIHVQCRKQKDFEPFVTFGCTCVKVGDKDESSIVVAGKTDLDALSRSEAQKEEDKELYSVLKHLPETQDKAVLLKDLPERCGRKKSSCDALALRAYNAKYALRQGQGTKGSPFAYWLSESGRGLVRRHAGLDLLGDV